MTQIEEQTQPEPPVIGVIIKIPAPQDAPNLSCPKNNRIGLRLLFDLIDRALELHQIQHAPGVYAFELNDGNLLFSPTELKPGLKVIKSELERLGLLLFCEISWYDADERIYRCYYPKGGTDKTSELWFDHVRARREKARWEANKRRR